MSVCAYKIIAIIILAASNFFPRQLSVTRFYYVILTLFAFLIYWALTNIFHHSIV